MEKRYIRFESTRRANLAQKELGLRSIVIVLAVGFFTGTSFCLFANYPWHLGSIFGPVAGVFINFSSGIHYHKWARKFINASNQVKEVHVTEIKALRFVEFEEYEDLGVIYGFEIEPGRIFILNGQDYYGTIRFPCLHFEIIDIPGVLYTIRPKSSKEPPYRLVPRDIMKELKFYKDRVVVNSNIEDIEEKLKRYSA